MNALDRLATMLASGARWARALPPAWDGAAISHALVDPRSGTAMGRLLPGRGLALYGDLAHYGITREIPYVYERTALGRVGEAVLAGARSAIDPSIDADSPVARSRALGTPLSPTQVAVLLLDQWEWEATRRRQASAPRAAIGTYDEIIASRFAGRMNDVPGLKLSITTVANSFSSLFRAGGLPPAGSYTDIPGGAVMTRASTGAWNAIFDPTGGRKKYLLTFGYGSTSSIDWGILVDLLVACGNISASVTSSQTIDSATQTRQYGQTLGAGVLATMEVTTALGTGTGTSSLTSYTNQDGTTARVSASGTSAASLIASRLFPTGGNSPPPVYALQSGDFGIRSVETFAFSAAHNAGVCALLLFYPLCFLPGLAPNLYLERDSTVQIDGVSELVTDGSGVIGCLTLLVQTASTSSGTVRMFARTTEG